MRQFKWIESTKKIKKKENKDLDEKKKSFFSPFEFVSLQKTVKDPERKKTIDTSNE